jgi:hypothetical protein
MGKLTKDAFQIRKKMFAEGWPVPKDKDELSIMNAMAQLRSDSKRRRK